MPIFGICSLLLTELDEKQPLYKDIRDIKAAAERCAVLIRQLMAFGRRQMLEPKVISLNAVINNMEKMLRRVIREDIELEKILEPELDNIKADAGQIEQIILNLTVNARDAMPKGGKLSIQTINVYLGEEFTSRHIDFNPGKYAVLVIRDTGVGMDKATQERIFEPFFTTKEKGRGTGLGLSIVYGIVKQSGGNIQVSSEPGKGTVFKIFLPVIEEPSEDELAQKSAGSAKSKSGTETVLVAEDDKNVLKVVKRAMKKLGYTVIEAKSGEEAEKLHAESRKTIHMLVTDVVMPGMDGKELATRLKSKDPGLKIIFISGYADSSIFSRTDLPPGAAFIQKPFEADALTLKIRELLDKQ
jgi:CheY-like chemotaxis protein